MPGQAAGRPKLLPGLPPAMKLRMAEDAPYPRDRIELALPDFFKYHADGEGRCHLCSWSMSSRSRSLALTFISSVCPVHGELPRGRVHPRATQRMRFAASVPE